MKYLVIDALGTDDFISTREQFEGLTLKQRHDQIKRQFTRGALKMAAKNQWIYLQVLDEDYAIRFKLDRKREIIAVETLDLAACADLMEQARLADAAVTYGAN
jgi:hypothetical protein